MVDSVKNYGLAGVSANVELGKQGAQIIGSDSSVISLVDKDGNSEIAAIANGTASSHAVTKAQLDDIVAPKLSISKTTIAFNSGTTALGTTDSNTMVHAVVIEKATNWSGADGDTEIIVGDTGDTDRLFSGFDHTSQVKIEPKHKYTSATTINAIVTAGGASTGTATVVIIFSGNLS
tara:strand:+ start:76 stop:606 length:531 start_codon:yes stop_codon:yes gene_type:complete